MTSRGCNRRCCVTSSRGSGRGTETADSRTGTPGGKDGRPDELESPLPSDGEVRQRPKVPVSIPFRVSEAAVDGGPARPRALGVVLPPCPCRSQCLAPWVNTETSHQRPVSRPKRPDQAGAPAPLPLPAEAISFPPGLPSLAGARDGAMGARPRCVSANNGRGAPGGCVQAFPDETTSPRQSSTPDPRSSMLRCSLARLESLSGACPPPTAALPTAELSQLPCLAGYLRPGSRVSFRAHDAVPNFGFRAWIKLAGYKS